MNYNQAETPMQDEADTQGIDSLAPAPNPGVILSTKNFAEDLDEDVLSEISERCKRGYELDRESREDWENEVEEWLKLANQIREAKSYPWPNASNIKYPLLSTAAMQFAARAYPALVPSNGKIVNNRVVGKDPQGQKLDKADRVSTFMSYQILNEIPGWEEDMDRMLMMLPVVGTIFKKTWYDKTTDAIRSEVLLPKNVVVNYWTKNLIECERISEVVLISRRLLKEKQNAGVFRDIDFGEPQTQSTSFNATTIVDETTPYSFIEQHTFYDLDDDGYEEPYIVTFEENTGKIARIQARYTQDAVEFKDDGKTIKRISPLQMYTKFGFVPNPDGSFYDIGFGILLGPLNESVNTLINVLVDSGHLSTLQAGFIGKGLRMKMGDSKFQPGEWKQVSATGDDLRKQIVPLPLKEPSNVLFQLLGTLITSGKELASVAEIFTGKMPGQNTPATTTMATVEQGMKVFTAVYKRIYRALAEEFDKIFDLNALYTDPNHMVTVLDIQIGPEDFDRKVCDISPGADPTAISQTEKLMKAQGLMELLQAAGPMLDPVKVISRILDAQEQPNWQDLFSEQVKQTGQVPPAPPDPKVMALQAKMQADQQTAAIKTAAMQQQMELDGRSKEQQLMMDAQEHAQKMQFNEEEAQARVHSQVANTQVKLATTLAQTQQASQQQAQTHQQQMQHKQESQRLALSQKAKSANGGKG
jgi:chaperonin GroES